MPSLRSKYARVVVWHNDPRGLELTLTNRSFRIEVLHRHEEQDQESRIDDILIDGSIGEVIHLLKTLKVDRFESAAKLLSVVGKLIIDSVPFNVVDAVEHLQTDSLPLTCFVTGVTKEEIIERLRLWQKERDQP